MSDRRRVIETYGHNGRVGVLVEFSLGTDFTAQMPEFRELAKNIAVQVAATNPSSLDVLLGEPFVKDSEKSVREILTDASNLLGESVSVIRFIRWDSEHRPPDDRPPMTNAAVVRMEI